MCMRFETNICIYLFIHLDDKCIRVKDWDFYHDNVFKYCSYNVVDLDVVFWTL